jgi:hypothetical protein
MVAEDFELPSAEQREYLIAGLARLVELRGIEPLVAAPLLLPDSRFFPDRVEQRGRGVATLLRRLAAYADLGSYGISVEVDQGLVGVLDEQGREARLDHAAAWFYDIRGGMLCFGVDEDELRDSEALIGTLGHETSAHGVAPGIYDLGFTMVGTGHGALANRGSLRYQVQ